MKPGCGISGGRVGSPPGLPRWVDYLAAALGICLLAPFLTLIWVLIRLDSPGPAVFRQPRVGRGGRDFVCWKFRTMHVDAAAIHVDLADLPALVFNPVSNTRDPRHTRLGGALRQTSIDELPQLLNVIRGEMALVGPRPEIRTIVAVYPEEYLRRHTVLPGITGLAQVNGRSDLAYRQIMKRDLAYVQQRSARTDLTILWRTLGAVFGEQGAR